MQRRTPEVTYTFEGEPGKYVLLEDYIHDVKIWVREVETAQSALLAKDRDCVKRCAQRDVEIAELREALEELTTACEKEFCSPATEEGEMSCSDLEEVAGPHSEINFGMIRRARQALSRDGK